MTDTYPLIVSTHNWLLEDSNPKIVVDSARLYIMHSQGIHGLDHSFASISENERHCREFSNLPCSWWGSFASSHDGRYVLFSHIHETSTDREPKIDSHWFIRQGNELEDQGFTRFTFENDAFHYRFLSRDGQVSCSYIGMNVTHVYQIVEEAGGSATRIRFKVDGRPLAISGRGTRVFVQNDNDQLKIYDISKDVAKLVCQIDVFGYPTACALNEDGSEAAYVKDNELRIMEVDKVSGDKVESAIASVNVPESLGAIYRLVYSDDNKLHLVHDIYEEHIQRGVFKVSLFDPSTKTFIPIETSQEGQYILESAISSNADYIATLESAGEEGKSKKHIYRTIVKRKLKNARGHLGCDIGKAAKQSQAHEESSYTNS